LGLVDPQLLTGTDLDVRLAAFSDGDVVTLSSLRASLSH
jgi:hypothetical protein